MSSQKNKILTIITLLLLTPLLAAAADQQVADTTTQIRTQITAEHIKTRTEITQYADKLANQVVEVVKNDGYKFLDELFQTFDNRIRILAIKIQFQLTLTIILSIIFANAIWYWIKTTIEKKNKKLPRNIYQDTYMANQYGQISPTYQEKITREDQTIIRPTNLTDTNNQKEPNTPSINQLEQMIQEQRQQREYQEKMKEAEKQRKENEKKAKEIQKLQEKADKKTRKLREKIQRIQKDINPIQLTETLPPPNPPSIFQKQN